MIGPVMVGVRSGAAIGVTLSVCLGVMAAPVANADPLDNVRNAVLGARNQSLCNDLQFSGELEGYAQQWVRTARALATLNTPTFPGAAYAGQTRQWIAQGDPTNAAISKLMSIATGDIQTCGYYQYGVGMVRDDVTDLSYVAVISGKPNAPAPNPGPPKVGLPPAPAAEPAQPVAPAPVPPPPEPAPAPAERSDMDNDGLFDDDETDVYGTNPAVADTDGDGPDDGQEVFDGTDPLDPNSP